MAAQRNLNSPTNSLPPELQRFRLLDEHQVASLTNISVQTLRNHRCTRRGLPYLKLGRSIRYPLSDVLKFLEARKICPEGVAE
jgi:predicted DNA-binding transcriptional regulator AlpA